jgi:hypothetical protein
MLFSALCKTEHSKLLMGKCPWCGRMIHAGEVIEQVAPQFPWQRIWDLPLRSGHAPLAPDQYVVEGPACLALVRQITETMCEIWKTYELDLKALSDIAMEILGAYEALGPSTLRPPEIHVSVKPQERSLSFRCGLHAGVLRIAVELR